MHRLSADLVDLRRSADAASARIRALLVDPAHQQAAYLAVEQAIHYHPVMRQARAEGRWSQTILALQEASGHPDPQPVPVPA